MMAERHPFQKLCCVRAASDSGSLLFAASGPSIFTFQLPSAKSTSRWSAIDGPDHALVKSVANPNKRIKLDGEQNGSFSRQESEESIEISVERRKGERRRPKVEPTKSSNVSHVLATTDGQCLVAITADDKTIHVFEIRGKDGVLVPQTSRSMPKRICAIVLDPDERNLVVGDKFGDVYSLPLHPSEGYVRPRALTEAFEPSATELTVHTKGNLEALRQQREQKMIKQRREGPDFEHKLLLGHVSLLTDVLVVKSDVQEHVRTFVLTSDRDEHIRISRYPQAHIIEGYCLGHRDFVSRLCIPRSAPEFLISGSGEPSMNVYDWNKGVLLAQKTFDGVRSAVQEVLDLSTEERSIDKLAVLGIWSIGPHFLGLAETGDEAELVLVALEGLPLLLSYVLRKDGTLHHQQTVKLSGNVLDVTHAHEEKLIMVSLDSAHAVGSMKSMERDSSIGNEMLVAFEMIGQTLNDTILRPAKIVESLNLAISDLSGMPDVPRPDNVQGKRSRGEYSFLGEFLYGLENLRKRRGAAAADDGEGDDDADEPEDVAE